MESNVTTQERGRITTRVSMQSLEKLQEAADLVGATVNQFIVQSALDKADEILERERVISLSQRDAAMLITMLDSPAAPNDALLRAVERFKKKTEHGNINTTAMPQS